MKTFQVDANFHADTCKSFCCKISSSSCLNDDIPFFCRTRYLLSIARVCRYSVSDVVRRPFVQHEVCSCQQVAAAARWLFVLRTDAPDAPVLCRHARRYGQQVIMPCSHRQRQLSRGSVVMHVVTVTVSGLLAVL